MFSGPSNNTWMKGDTFLEVASVLVRTNIDDPVSFDSALEVVKRYARSKMKKGKGKEVAGKGGKLEALETKYAHLGFQDIFYLTRLQLSLPPSAIKLPRPTSPTRKVLVKAKYPLPEEYKHSREEVTSPPGPRRGTMASIAMSDTALARRASERGGDQDIRAIPIQVAEPAAEPQSIPFIYATPTPGLSRSSSSATGTSGVPTPLPMLSPVDLSTSTRSPLGMGHHISSMRRVPSGSSSTSGRSMDQIGMRRAPKAPGSDEGDVKRMLEARIKALQSALDSLDVNEESSPAEALEAKADAFRRDLPPLAPPPKAPLPPTPHTPPSAHNSPLRTSPRNFAPSFPSPPVRSPDGHLSNSPRMDPDVADDPFAAPVRSIGTAQTRADRERAAWRRVQADLRRIKEERGEVGRQGGITPPPTYEA